MSLHRSILVPASILALFTAAIASGCDDGRPAYTGGGENGGADLAMGPCKGCPTGMCCGNACVDLKKDAANCGACGKKCGAGETCVGGVCGCEGGPSCPADQVCCAKFGCKNLKTDGNHCGACGNSCAAANPNENCYQGACGCGVADTHCTAPQLCCNDACIDVSSDPMNCGDCGNTCAQGQTCTNSMCGGGGGGCNPPCKPGEQCILNMCIGGGMTCNPPCQPGEQCLLGMCIGGGMTCNPPCMPPKQCILGLFCL